MFKGVRLHNIFTVTAAQQFVNRLINAIFIDADIAVIEQYYAADAVVHYGEIVINRDDIINRANYNKGIYTQHQHFLLEVITFANTIVFRDKQQAYNKETNQFISVDLTGVYRIENEQVQEAWLMTDAQFNYKANMEKGERDGMPHHDANLLQVDINTAYKMFTKMINKKLAGSYPNVELSQREMECLFYTLSGRSAKETAAILGLSIRTIEHYLENLKLKLDCSSKTQLRHKLVPGGIWL